MDKEKYQSKWTRTSTREGGQGGVPEKVDKEKYQRRWTRRSTREGGQGGVPEKVEKDEYQRRWTRRNTRKGGQGEVPEQVDKDAYQRRWTWRSTREGGQGGVPEKVDKDTQGEDRVCRPHSEDGKQAERLEEKQGDRKLQDGKRPWGQQRLIKDKTSLGTTMTYVRQGKSFHSGLLLLGVCGFFVGFFFFFFFFGGGGGGLFPELSSF